MYLYQIWLLYVCKYYVYKRILLACHPFLFVAASELSFTLVFFPNSQITKKIRQNTMDPHSVDEGVTMAEEEKEIEDDEEMAREEEEEMVAGRMDEMVTSQRPLGEAARPSKCETIVDDWKIDW